MRWVRPLVSLILLVVLLQIADFSQVIAQLSRIPPTYVGAGLLLFALSIVVFVYKWRLCLPTARYPALLRSYLSSLFFFLLPTGTLGAEASKLTVAKSQGIPLATVAASITLDKLTGLAALALVGVLAGVVGGHPFGKAATAALLLGALAIVVATHATRYWGKLKWPVRGFAGIARRIASLAEALGKLAEQRGLIWKNVAVGMVSQSAMVGVYACLAAGLGFAVSLPVLAFCVVAANLAAVLPISMAGIGVREVGLVALLGSVGIQAEAAAALALSVFAIFLVGSLVGFANELIPAADRSGSR